MHEEMTDKINKAKIALRVVLDDDALADRVVRVAVDGISRKLGPLLDPSAVSLEQMRALLDEAGLGHLVVRATDEPPAATLAYTRFLEEQRARRAAACKRRLDRRFARRSAGTLRDPKGRRTRPPRQLANVCDGVHPPDAIGPCAFCALGGRS